MLKSVLKMGAVLDLFTEQAPEWGVTEVATALGVSKSNAHSVLTTVESLDLLRRTESGRFRLGMRSFALACQISEAAALKDLSGKYLRHTSAVLGVTTHLSVRRDHQVFFLGRATQPGGVVFKAGAAGSALPAHLTASGRVLLTTLTDEGVAELIDTVQWTGRPRLDRTAMVDDIEKARANRYAVSVGQVVSGLAQAAVPIYDSNGEVVAALGVSMRQDRFGPFRAGPPQQLANAARLLSHAVRTQIAVSV